MRRTMLNVIILPALLACLGGCGCRDISNLDEVRAGGMLGRKIALRERFLVVEVPHLKRLMLVSMEDAATLGPDERVKGELSPGTSLTVSSVEECSYPPGITTRFTVATVDDGVMRGIRITTDRAGIGYRSPLRSPPPLVTTSSSGPGWELK